MNKYTSTSTLIYFIFSLLMISCTKSQTDPATKNGKISMKINGESWNSNFAHTITAPRDSDDKYLLVSIYGSEVESKDVNVGMGLAFTIYVPFDKFKNPIGTYNIVGNEDPSGVIFANMKYTKGEIKNFRAFYSIDGGENLKPVGTVTITDFKIGEINTLGISTGEGYTSLKGTFQCNLLELKEKGFGELIEVSDGKFEVNN